MRKSLRRNTPSRANSSNGGSSGLTPPSSTSYTIPMPTPMPTPIPTMSSSYSSYSPFLLIIITVSAFLCSVYRDTMIASQMFAGNISLAQTKPDTHLRHILPTGMNTTRKNKDGKDVIQIDIPTPSALASPDAITVLKPTLGMHRSNQDAIFAIGDGLQLSDFVLFIISLRNTGFDGDIVFSTWNRNYLEDGIWEFLEYYSKDGVVVYEGVIIADKAQDSSSNGNLTDIDPLKLQNIHLHEMNNTKVWLHGLYGKHNANGVNKNLVYLDPRVSRSIGVARFELYWVWSLNYNTQSRILLIDAKDTYFQPFAQIGIGVGMNCEESEPVTLHLYEV
jgi:hypothetical protein